MSWVVVGVAAVGALTADQQRKAQEKHNQQAADVSAAQMQYSPWTGVKPSAPNLSPVTSSALQGGLQGGLSGAIYKSQNPSAPTDPTASTGGTSTDAQLNPDQLKARQQARGF